jgi:WD40 repeat protein
MLAQGGMDSKIVLWDPADPREHKAVLSGQQTAVFGLSFGPGNTLAAGTADNGGVVLWDVTRRAQQAVIHPGTTGTEPFFLPGSSFLLMAATRYKTGPYPPGLSRHARSPGCCPLAGTPSRWANPASAATAAVGCSAGTHQITS